MKPLPSILSPLTAESFLLLFFLILSFSCQKNDSEPEPHSQMSLTAKINGKSWTATEFRVDEEDITSQNPYLSILATDSRVLNPYTSLTLIIYEYKTPGAKITDRSINSIHQTCILGITTNGVYKDYSGPVTFELTSVENGNYEGTFKGQMCHECQGDAKLSIEGSFKVRKEEQALK
ncbi:hypothetical protein [Xanthocytophaga agilis]|uniref:Lipoprotein n=1 Tax=Xanthocytophaga agilis TaxID=3048010 RepID=A0AAE3RBS2_9BACT|nr:hypothetical protein [Xanthocytophaga agilis]MDJ1505234.1 hypothetical protein [Xanthocytophaga agilis]